MDENTTAKETIKVYSEEKTGFFAKAKAAVKAHKKGIIVGGATTLLVSGGAALAKMLQSKGVDMPAEAVTAIEDVISEA